MRDLNSSSALKAGAAQFACPDRFDGPLATGSCYRVLPPMTWGACAYACAAAGGFLACISSTEENDLFVSLQPPTRESCGWSSQRGCLWIGLTQSVTSEGAAHWDAA